MSVDQVRSGVTFNVQGYSIHDGPGIRTTVFLKGCPLRCFWCQNPESQRTSPEIFFAADKCTGCGKCISACSAGAITLAGGKARTDRERCGGAAACVSACPVGARNQIGRAVTPEEIFAEVAEDTLFYEQSGGGVTLSGGEPLFHSPFAAELLRLCKRAGIHTALDTCGYASWINAARVLKHVDLVLYDFKHMDSEQHQLGTGVPNELILENARKIHRELSISMLARIPIIPGYNDSIDNMRATAQFIAQELDSSVPVHLNPYHRLGEAKVERLERSPACAATEPPGDAHMADIKRLFESFGLSVVIGG